MDTRRPHGAEPADDASDDLIAELARLVGQENRQPAQPKLADRVEPRLTPASTEAPVSQDVPPEPQRSSYAPAVPPTPVPPRPAHTVSSERVEPGFSREPSPEARERVDGLEFDFGFGGSDGSGAAEDDPIAALIADADQDAQRAEMSRWQDDEPVAGITAPEPEPNFVPETVAAAPRPVAAAVPPRPPVAPVSVPTPEPVRDTARDIRDRDPLSEIEALIGEAARVNAEPGPMGSRKVRSVYAEPPMAAPPVIATAQIDTPSEPDGLTAAERAIHAASVTAAPRAESLRAAAPVQARDERYETELADDDDAPLADEEFITRPPRRRRGGIIVPAAIGGVILVGAVAGYFTIFGQTATVTGEPPVLVADADPAKIEPDPSTTASATADSVVFNDIAGGGASEDSTLVSRDETDGAAGAAVSSLLTPEAAADEETGLANRRVRTVTVRPDGTIVTGDDPAVAGTSVLPVDRPDVPALPGASADDPIGDAIAQAMGGGSPTTFESETVVAPGEAPETLVASTDASDTPLDPLEPLDGAAPADPALEAALAAEAGADVPLPLPRPNDLPVVTAAAAPAAEADTTTTTDATTTPAGPVGAWVQLSSQRSEDAARAGIPELERRYGVLFNGTPLDVSSVDLGTDGVYYRVRLPQPSMADANNVCQTIIAAGGDCFVLSN